MRIAISGGIGSGKSTVSNYLRSLGYRVIDADGVNRELLADKGYLALLKDEFPTCFEGDTFIKERMRALIFNDDNARLRLNALSHPAIFQRIEEEAARAQGLIFAEVPLLAESGKRETFDKIWVVTVSPQVQLERLIKRDKLTLDKAKQIVASQKVEAQTLEFADLIINNDKSPKETEAQVASALKNLNVR